MSTEDFEKLVQKAILALPEQIRARMENVAVVIEERPSSYHFKKARIIKKYSLLGLYQGVPKTTWGRGLGMRLPDKITIFQEPIEKIANSDEEIKEIVKSTVWHEIAHHFGLSENKVRSLEPKWRKSKS